ncbi:hypothetical protein CYLTODRAFT_343854, partial [Cylindrobasidium torrendii FP15055 ss-10]
VRYQIFNGLQAFCSSLATMLSSRAVLEGFGVGNANATSNAALIITVMQDVASRLTTIVSAYFIGTMLVPEAKTYRLLADVLNDSAIVLDTLTPHYPEYRVPMLCLSASLRSLCAIAAGGSKTAISVHFARRGDLGDLNAKDSSKETVLALMGMLLGSLIVPKVTNPSAIYLLLSGLVTMHLLINYLGIRGLELVTLNRQRATLLWKSFEVSMHASVPTPAVLAQQERLFFNHQGLPKFALHGIPSTQSMTANEDGYILCPHNEVWIVLKEGHGPITQLRAWVHALGGDLKHFQHFVESLERQGWIVNEGGLVTRLPRRVIISNPKSE